MPSLIAFGKGEGREREGGSEGREVEGRERRGGTGQRKEKREGGEGGGKNGKWRGLRQFALLLCTLTKNDVVPFSDWNRKRLRKRWRTWRRIFNTVQSAKYHIPQVRRIPQYRKSSLKLPNYRK